MDGTARHAFYDDLIPASDDAYDQFTHQSYVASFSSKTMEPYKTSYSVLN